MVDYINLNLPKENVRRPFDDNRVNLTSFSHTLKYLQTEHPLYFLKKPSRITTGRYTTARSPRC